MTAGIMRRFRMTKIAAVDSPAQKGALAVILKRDDTVDKVLDDSLYEKISKRTFTADERKKAESSGAAMPGGRYPIENTGDLHNAIRAVGRGKGSHAAIRSHIMSRARALGATAAIPDDWKASKADVSRLRIAIRKSDFKFVDDVVSKFASRLAKDAVDEDANTAELFGSDESGDEANECYRDLCKSVASILGDDEVDRPTLLQETLNEFKDALQDVVPDGLEPAIGKSLGAEGSPDMSLKAIAKSLGLDENASEADIVKAGEEKKKKAEELDAEKAKAEKRDAQIAKMSDKHKTFMNHPDAKMPKGGKSAFADMEPAERDAHMSANSIEADDDDGEMEKAIKKGDAFKTPDGAVFRKSDFGNERAFQLAKSQNETIANQGDKLAKSEEQRMQGVFAKKAELLPYIGKADEVGVLLLDIAKFDSKLADRAEALLVALNKRFDESSLFEEKGSGARPAGGEFGKAAGQIDALARDLVSKEPDLVKHATLDKIGVARSIIRKRRPDLAKQEESEAEQGRPNRRKAA